MPRRRIVFKTERLLDPKYDSPVVLKFVTRMMVCGKKSVSLNLFYRSLDLIQQKMKQDPVEVFLKALENVKPVIEVKSRRVGGSTFQVPVEIKDNRREALGMRWLVQYARARSGRTMSDKLCAEFMDAFNSTGSAFKKKEDTHRMAEANKAFAHYRW